MRKGFLAISPNDFERTGLAVGPPLAAAAVPAGVRSAAASASAGGAAEAVSSSEEAPPEGGGTLASLGTTGGPLGGATAALLSLAVAAAGMLTLDPSATLDPPAGEAVLPAVSAALAARYFSMCRRVTGVVLKSHLKATSPSERVVVR